MFAARTADSLPGTAKQLDARAIPDRHHDDRMLAR